MLPATIHVRIIVLCLSKKRAAGHWESQINGIATRLSAAIRALQVCAEARWPRLRSTRRSAQRASTYAVWRLLPEPWLGHHVTRSDHPHGHRHANHVEFPLGVDSRLPHCNKKSRLDGRLLSLIPAKRSRPEQPALGLVGTGR